MSSPAIQTLNNLTFGQTAALALIVGGLYWMNVYNDGSKLVAQIAETQTSLQAEEEKKKETDKVKEKEAAIKNEVGALSDKFREVTARFPVNLKSDEIISTVNQLAKSSNVRVVTVKKESVETRELYEEIPVRLEVTGTFNNLMMLMYNIGTLERVTNLGNFEFSSTTNEYTGTLKLITKVIGYKYRKPAEKKDGLGSSDGTGGGI